MGRKEEGEGKSPGDPALGGCWHHWRRDKDINLGWARGKEAEVETGSYSGELSNRTYYYVVTLISLKILLEIHCRSLGEERPTRKQAKKPNT